MGDTYRHFPYNKRLIGVETCLIESGMSPPAARSASLYLENWLRSAEGVMKVSAAEARAQLEGKTILRVGQRVRWVEVQPTREGQLVAFDVTAEQWQVAFADGVVSWIDASLLKPSDSISYRPSCHGSFCRPSVRTAHVSNGASCGVQHVEPQRMDSDEEDNCDASEICDIDAVWKMDWTSLPEALSASTCETYTPRWFHNASTVNNNVVTGVAHMDSDEPEPNLSTFVADELKHEIRNLCEGMHQDGTLDNAKIQAKANEQLFGSKPELCGGMHFQQEPSRRWNTVRDRLTEDLCDLNARRELAGISDFAGQVVDLRKSSRVEQQEMAFDERGLSIYSPRRECAAVDQQHAMVPSSSTDSDVLREARALRWDNIQLQRKVCSELSPKRECNLTGGRTIRVGGASLTAACSQARAALNTRDFRSKLSADPARKNRRASVLQSESQNVPTHAFFAAQLRPTFASATRHRSKSSEAQLNDNQYSRSHDMQRKSKAIPGNHRICSPLGSPPPRLSSAAKGFAGIYDAADKGNAAHSAVRLFSPGARAKRLSGAATTASRARARPESAAAVSQ